MRRVFNPSWRSRGSCSPKPSRKSTITATLSTPTRSIWNCFPAQKMRPKFKSVSLSWKKRLRKPPNIPHTSSYRRRDAGATKPLPNLLEEFSRPLVMLETFFFGAEFGRVSLESTCGRAQGMLYMEHLVIKDQFDRVGRHLRAIQAIIHNDLIERGIEGTELRAPGARAPTEARAAQVSIEVFKINRRKHWIEVMGHAPRIVHDAPRAFTPDSRDVTPRGMREGELAIEIAQLGRQSPAVHFRQ